MMRYLLALLTHGPAPFLAETLRTFHKWVGPAPAGYVAVVDGPGTQPMLPPGRDWHVLQHVEQRGFCEASAALWRHARTAAIDNDVPYVFWLENDFRFLRPVQVDLMADTLRKHPVVAQMALMRQPVNEKEKKAGSLVAANPNLFHKRQGWMEHVGFWTTNPSLIPVRTMVEHDWPTGAQCEGHMGIRLKGQARTFGYWGNGDVWVEHLGHRDGTGKGY
jgi:hypothetical protein